MTATLAYPRPRRRPEYIAHSNRPDLSADARQRQIFNIQSAVQKERQPRAKLVDVHPPTPEEFRDKGGLARKQGEPAISATTVAEGRVAHVHAAGHRPSGSCGPVQPDAIELEECGMILALLQVHASWIIPKGNRDSFADT